MFQNEFRVNMLPLKRHLSSAVFAVMLLCAGCMMILTAPAISSATEQLNRNQQHADFLKSVVHLYFADKKNLFLLAEERTLLHADNPVELGRMIVEALIQGPRQGLMQSIPAAAALRSLYVTPDGTAYVDITAAIKDAHPGGVQSEQMTVFSIVNSLVLNIPEVDTVKILIDGGEAMTLAGHIDLRYPFKANMMLIR